MPVRAVDDDADLFLPVPGATSRVDDDRPATPPDFEFDGSSQKLGRRLKTAGKYGRAAIELVAGHPPFSRGGSRDDAASEGDSVDGAGEGGGEGRPTMRAGHLSPPSEASPTALDGDRGNRDLPTNGAYDNWSCEDHNITHSNNNPILSGDELAWKIISAVLKGWFIIWILFALLVVSAEVFSPHHPTKKTQSTKAVLSVEDEQIFLEISETVVEACAYSNLDAEEGREGCQDLCHDRMCCFDDDGDGYGCVDDPEKMCAAYAGCESLIVTEDDAIIYDADGIDVFDEGADAGDVTNGVDSPSMDPSAPPNIGAVSANSTSSSELQLIQQVVSTICAPGALHTRHGLMECASLCNPSMCCFDRNEIEELNPKMDLILRMEGITNDILDRSAMGTCIDEGKIDDARVSGHFCEVHATCENLLLFGAPHSVANAKKRDPFALATGVSNEQDRSGARSDQQRTLITVGVLFWLMIGLTAYLLLFKRASSPEAIGSVLRNVGNRGPNAGGANDSEMVEFV